jgi:hypothetical protein
MARSNSRRSATAGDDRTAPLASPEGDETMATVGPHGEQVTVPERVGAFEHCDTRNPQTTAWHRVWGNRTPQGNGDPSNYPHVRTVIYVIASEGSWAIRRRTSNRGWSVQAPPNVPHASGGGHPVQSTSTSETLATALPSLAAALQTAVDVMQAASAIAPPIPPVAISPIQANRHGTRPVRATTTLEYLTYHGCHPGAAMSVDLSAVHNAANIEAVQESTPDRCAVPTPAEMDTESEAGSGAGSMAGDGEADHR